jgi:ABC-type branched-subunit amino acid transport system ATPase component
MNGIVLNKISKRFGDFWVLRDIRAIIPSGKISAFIGPNGAGKTTLFHIMSGMLKPDEGHILYNNNDITGFPAFKVARQGIGRQFQDIRVFSGMSVLENVMVSMIPFRAQDSWHSFLNVKRNIQNTANRRSKALQWLEYVGLENHYKRSALELSYGEQKLLTLARLFAANFDCLLLDEPTAGVSYQMIEQITDLLDRSVKEKKLTIVLIEHNINVVSDLADWVHFLHEGKIAFCGEGNHVLGNQSVRELYMGL